MTYNDLTLLAIKAALAGGKEILEVYNSDDFEVQLKSDDSPLTKADQMAHNTIVDFLSKETIPILSEEGKKMDYSQRKDWNQLWVVDPLDGTKEFIKRNGEFTVNIALVENGVSTLGVIYVPVLKELYFSNSEIGSYKISRVGTSTQVPDDINEIVEAADKLPLDEKRSVFMVVGSRSHMTDETKEYINSIIPDGKDVEVLSKGSSLKICMVAEGSADVYPRFAPTMEWDTAAGQAIAVNAGYEMVKTDSDESLTYNKEDLLNPWFIVRKKKD